MPAVAVPSLDGKGESLANFAQEVELWIRETNMDVTQSASALDLHMDPVGRDVRIAVSSEKLSKPDGAIGRANLSIGRANLLRTLLRK